jgi:ribosomal protein S18 acetylase RimI-like enzyme
MITLRRMTQKEYDAWRPSAEAAYAADHVRAGNWSEAEAADQARTAFDQLLTHGLDTENHHVCTIADKTTGDAVGHVWYCVESTKAGPRLFIADIGIDEPHRRKGYATATLKALEGEAAVGGAGSIRLHVFGDNAAARGLYAALGYRETNVQMVKTLAV